MQNIHQLAQKAQIKVTIIFLLSIISSDQLNVTLYSNNRQLFRVFFLTHLNFQVMFTAYTTLKTHSKQKCELQ